MKSLSESLFDVDLTTKEVTTLYELFGKHIKKFQHTYGIGLGWTHFFNQPAVVREWKAEGRPVLSGGFAKTTFPPDLQKFIAVILNNTIVSKDGIINMSKDGLIDATSLNNELDKKDILLSADTMWGAGHARHQVKVQLSYTYEDSSRFGIVGSKRYKGLNTSNIEISIYCYRPDRPGFGSHIWTLLTDFTINDLKK